MGLLLVAGGVALVLALLVLVTIGLVQLVLFVTVRNTVGAVAVAGVYWFITSHRRQVAKGFYSCVEVPGNTDAQTTPAATQRRPTRSARDEKTVLKREASAEAVMAAFKNEAKSSDHNNRRSSESTDSATTTTQWPLKTDTMAPADETIGVEERLSHASNASDAESCAEEVQVAASSTRSSDASPSKLPSSTPTRLPDLRHRRWKHPTRSLPLVSSTKGEALLQENRKSTGSGSAANSPRRPELYGSSPRAIAMEQKLMKNALESDGYFIGDFRLPPPSSLKRSHSMGTSKTSTSSASMAPPLPASSSFRHTGSRAV